jgi:hypothetical protein
MLALIATTTAKSIMDAPQSWRQALAKIVDSPQHTAASRSVSKATTSRPTLPVAPVTRMVEVTLIYSLRLTVMAQC